MLEYWWGVGWGESGIKSEEVEPPIQWLRGGPPTRGAVTPGTELTLNWVGG